jgi:hypothetical protein
MTAVGKKLRVLCGETTDDNGIIRRCVPGRGFDAEFAIPCPDYTGPNSVATASGCTSANGIPKSAHVGR